MAAGLRIIPLFQLGRFLSAGVDIAHKKAAHRRMAIESH
jgi:hypothetical protein